MLFFNIPNDFHRKKSVFGRPELVYCWALLYERAARDVAPRYQNLGIQRGECVISASYLASLMDITDSLAASYLRSLEAAELIIRKKVKGLTECVFQIPQILNPEPGEFTTVYMPENKRLVDIWEKGKHLLQVYFFLAINMAKKKRYDAYLKDEIDKNFVGTTLEKIKYHCNCTINEVRGAIKALEEFSAIIKKGFQGIGTRIFMAVMAKFGKKTEEKPKKEQVKPTIRTEAAPVQEQPRTTAPSPIINHPPVKDPPSDPIEEGVRHYLYDLKKVKHFDPSLFVQKLRDMFNKQGYDQTLLSHCLDDLQIKTDFISEYPDPDALSKKVDAWYQDHSQGLEHSSGTNGAATVAPEHEKQAKNLLDKIWSEMGRSRYEYIFTKHVSCTIKDGLVSIHDLQTTCQRIHDNSYAQEAIAKSVSAIFGLSMKYEVIPLKTL